MTTTTSNKPARVFRRRGVKVSVFRNEAGEHIFHKVVVQKIYKEGGGEWRTTTSLGRDDLPVAQMLIGRAWEFILDEEARTSAAGRESVEDKTNE